MRLTLFLLINFMAILSFSQEKIIPSKQQLKASASVSLNTNGMAPVPAFSLDKPAIMASVLLIKNRFSYEPTLAYGFDRRPWFIDNWMHYKLIVKPAFELRAGFNPSSYFSQYALSDEYILYCQRFYTFELAGMYRFSHANSLSLLCWSDRGQETGSIKGLYFGLFWDKPCVNFCGKVEMDLSIQLYYINYTGNNDGLFISPKITSPVRKSPFSIFLQANQAIQSNITPFPKFKFNTGISYTF